MSDYEFDEYGFDEEYEGEFDEYHGGYIEDIAAYKDVFGDDARGGGMVEREGLFMGTEIVGGGALRDIQQHIDRIGKDPREQFRIEVEQELSKYDELGLDAFVLRKYIDNLFLIEYKNPNAYILGYYLSLYIPDSPEKVLRRVKSTIEKELHTLRITMFEVLKYAVWWKKMLIQ